MPAAVVPHADPLPHNGWAFGSVTNQHASAGPLPDFVGVHGAAQAVVVPSVVPPMTAIRLPVPPLPIPVFQMPAITAPTQPLQVPRQINRRLRDRISSAVLPLQSVQVLPDASNLVCHPVDPQTIRTKATPTNASAKRKSMRNARAFSPSTVPRCVLPRVGPVVA